VTLVDKVAMRLLLARHEVHGLQFTPDGTGRSAHGFWVPVATCGCGHTSPPERRADHLADVLINNVDTWLVRDPTLARE